MAQDETTQELGVGFTTDERITLTLRIPKNLPDKSETPYKPYFVYTLDISTARWLADLLNRTADQIDPEEKSK